MEPTSTRLPRRSWANPANPLYLPITTRGMGRTLPPESPKEKRHRLVAVLDIVVLMDTCFDGGREGMHKVVPVDTDFLDRSNQGRHEADIGRTALFMQPFSGGLDALRVTPYLGTSVICEQVGPYAHKTSRPHQFPQQSSHGLRCASVARYRSCAHRF